MHQSLFVLKAQYYSTYLYAVKAAAIVSMLCGGELCASSAAYNSDKIFCAFA